MGSAPHSTGAEEGGGRGMEKGFSLAFPFKGFLPDWMRLSTERVDLPSSIQHACQSPLEICSRQGRRMLFQLLHCAL